MGVFDKIGEAVGQAEEKVGEALHLEGLAHHGAHEAAENAADDAKDSAHEAAEKAREATER